MIVRRDLKSSIRSNFKGHFWDVILLGFVLYLIPNIISNLADNIKNDTLNMMVSVILVFVILFITGMQLLVTQTMYRHPEEKTFKNAIKISFKELKKYWKGILFVNLWSFLFVCLWMIPVAVIGLIIAFQFESEIIASTIAIITAIVSTLIIIIKQYQYTQGLYLYRDAIDRGEIIKTYRSFITKSKNLMKGHLWEYFVLQLSFVWWIVLEVVTIGLGSIWVNPYIDSVNAAYYDALLAQHTN